MPISSEITPNRSPYLSSTNTGLGNCLFQIASIYGIGRTYSIEVVYDNVVELGKKLRTAFQYNHDTTIFRNFTKLGGQSTTPIQETLWRQYDPSFLDSICKRKDENVCIYGHLEVPLYFKQYTSELQTLFAPDEASRKYLYTTYPFLVSSQQTVAIHIRSYKELGFPNSLPISYYIKAIDHIESLLPNPHYVVCADHSCERVDFLEGKSYTILKNPEDYLDCWAMSMCKHYILSQSTFSYWGWFLNPSKEKITCVPKWQSMNFYDDEDVYVV